MHDMLATSLLIGSIVLCVFTTITAAARPEEFAKSLGLAVQNAGGRNEIRAQYAGFFLAAALACGAALTGTIPRFGALLVMLVVFGGLFVGRIVSLIGNRGFAGFGPVVSALCFIDAVGFAASVGALWPN